MFYTGCLFLFLNVIFLEVDFCTSKIISPSFREIKFKGKFHINHDSFSPSPSVSKLSSGAYCPTRASAALVFWETSELCLSAGFVNPGYLDHTQWESFHYFSPNYVDLIVYHFFLNVFLIYFPLNSWFAYFGL